MHPSLPFSPMSNKSSKTRTLTNIIQNALKHYHDPAWLGRSPLATPYFLGAYLVGNSAETPTHCGHILQKLLYDAASKLWGSELPRTRHQLAKQIAQIRANSGRITNQYLFYLLELRYFRKYHTHHNETETVEEIITYLVTTTPSFHKNRKKAIQALSIELLKLFRPTFRLEQPNVLNDMLGRSTLLTSIPQQLAKNQAVMLSGMGGIGKTTLGVAIYADWDATPAFWYTFRPSLNDQLDSLLFSLAHFLNQHGARTLWSQLIANTETTQNNKGLLLGSLEHDLQEVRPLLCFDEVDRLAAIHAITHNPNHGEIIELLELLITLTPVLLMGQHSIVDSPQHYALIGFTIDESSNLLQKLIPTIEPSTIAKWHQWTYGNPRLLKLYAMLHQNKVAIRAKEADLSGPFQRLWRRLAEAERQLLATLSVYRSPAPMSYWKSEQPVMVRLIQRQLIIQDAQDGIEMLPAWRHYLYQHILLQETREVCHEQAAIVRLQQGEYTSATYHYAKSGEIVKALDVWYRYRTLEIGRGFSATARDIFLNLSARQIPASHKKKLMIVRNELHIATGDLEAIIATSIPRPPELHHTIEDVIIDQGRTQGEHFLGRPASALEQSEIALTRLAYLFAHEASVHRQRGHILLSEGHLQEAYHEAEAIRIAYQHLQAEVARRSGRFSKAEEVLIELLESADISPRQRANIQLSLARIYGQLGNLELGKQYIELAAQFHQTTGNRVFQETLQMELAGMHLAAGKFTEVTEYGEPALLFFRKIKHVAALPFLFNYLAEAYFELGNIEKAFEYANAAYQTEHQGEFPNTCYTLGRIHVLKKAYTLARTVFNLGIEVCEKNSDIFFKAYLLRERSKLNRLKGMDTEAATDRSEAAKLFKRMRMGDEIDK